MNTALKVFVCGFSFVFSAYFCALVFAVLLHPLSGGLEYAGHPYLALAASFVPLAPAGYAGYRAARAALDLERQRQARARAKQP